MPFPINPLIEAILGDAPINPAFQPNSPSRAGLFQQAAADQPSPLERWWPSIRGALWDMPARLQDVPPPVPVPDLKRLPRAPYPEPGADEVTPPPPQPYVPQGSGISAAEWSAPTSVGSPFLRSGVPAYVPPPPAPGPTGPEPPLPMRRTLAGDMEPSLALTGTKATSDALAARSIAEAAGEAYTGPGGYHPRNDVMELRGGWKSLTSPYGVGVPSNAAIGRYQAGREKVGLLKQQADSDTETAKSLTTRAATEKAAQEFAQSPEAQAQTFLGGLAGTGDPEALAEVRKRAGIVNPLASLARYGMAPTLPPGVDEFITQYARGGGPPIDVESPLAKAFLEKYGPIGGARMRGEPYGLMDAFTADRPQVFGRRAPGVGVPGLVGPPKPSMVKVGPTSEQAKEAKRKKDAYLEAARMFNYR